VTAPSEPQAGAVRSVAVVGAGWAGLAAAVHACSEGQRVTLYEMAPQPGGRAREVRHADHVLDNGQHILIGAYRDTLALMRKVGVDHEQVLMRRPLALIDPRGVGLRLPHGPVALAFARGVLAQHAWPWADRWALLGAALRWRGSGFRAPTGQSVSQLCAGLPATVREQLIDPLCVAALNTPAAEASAQVFLRVLRDALFGGRGAADLLLPKVTLSALLPKPAAAWLKARGASLRLRSRVATLSSAADGRWRVEGEPFDAVVLACGANEASRLTQGIDAAWSAMAGDIAVQPIVTVYLRSAGSQLVAPMVALAGDAEQPAQFAFDLGAIAPGAGRNGVFAFVVSGAREWVERGAEACEQATLRQAMAQFPSGTWRQPPQVLCSIAERRATFACTPSLARPRTLIAPGLCAAGDYVEGPYPATLEGAVRSGMAALRALELGSA
jgi:hydroxysqualene dehydroxylase